MIYILLIGAALATGNVVFIYCALVCCLVGSVLNAVSK